MHKTIGIRGGMGPAATADLMNKIIERTDASCDQEHIPMIIDSNTRIPDRTAAIKGEGPSPASEMLNSARRLEAAGADFLIIPCNTAHHFIRDIESDVSIPILDMMVETANLLQRRGVKCAAVLATEGTYLSGRYDRVLGEKGIEAINPTPAEQEVLMSLIYDYIKSGITEARSLPRDQIKELTGGLKSRGAQAILMACTELPLAFAIMDLIDDSCVDPTAVLAEAAIREAGARIR